MGESVGDPTATRAHIRGYAGRIVRPLSHRFFLLVVGALLTSLVIPSITRGWQDHQRQVELQDELASTITRAATKYIVARARWREVGARGEWFLIDPPSSVVGGQPHAFVRGAALIGFA